MNVILEAMRQTAKNKFEEAAGYYMLLFCAKHQLNIEESFWVGVDIGGVFCCDDLFVNYTDMRTDIDMNADEDAIYDWQEYYMKEHQAGNSPINYENFLKLNS